MRIAHLVPLIRVGGTEAVILDLCRHRSRGHTAVVGALAPELSVMAEEIRATGAAVYAGRTAWSRAALEADVVNLHCWGYDPAMISFLQRLGRPWVVTLHCHAVLPPLPVLTICTSAYVRTIQAAPERCVVIPNGIDTLRFRPRPRAHREEVVVSRICRTSKCAPYFWPAMRRVLDRYPQARLRIVGNETTCRFPGERVEFLGVRRDIPEILADTDIFAYTPYPEFGTKDLVVMEASAAGVPAVLPDVSVVRESVEPGVNAFLTPYGDVEALSAAVGRLVADTALRQEMGRRAAKMAAEQFDVRQVAARYEQVYAAVRGHHGAAYLAHRLAESGAPVATCS